MGNMTNDMTRLRGEVDGLRAARVALMHDLAQGAKNLGVEVAAMRADFTGAHAAMAKKARKGREAFVSGTRKRVNRMRREFSSDLAGARSGWRGK